MFIQTILQTILKRKRNKTTSISGSTPSEASPLVKKVLSAMKKHSLTRNKTSTTKSDSQPKETK
jgi:hypothetical protein